MPRWESNTIAYRPLLLGAALGALAVGAVVGPRFVAEGLFPTEEPFSPKVVTEPPGSTWPPRELRDDPRWQLLEYGDDGWATPYVGTYEKLGEYLATAPPGGNRLAIPLFPTVYQPDISDKIYYDTIAQSDIAPGDKVLVVGTGSGADSWAVWRKSRSKVYAVELNPMSVVNARATARLGGFELEALVGDFTEIELPDEFRDFDYVLWNMPFVDWKAAEDDPSTVYHYDGDDGTIVAKFLERLPDLLKPDGQAIALNYAAAQRFMTTPGITTRVADDVEEVASETYMVFFIPNPATQPAVEEVASDETVVTP